MENAMDIPGPACRGGKGERGRQRAANGVPWEPGCKERDQMLDPSP